MKRRTHEESGEKVKRRQLKTMEINLEVSNYTSYYNASQLSKNLSIEENTREPLECKQEINSSGLFDFIIYGILVNLIGIFGIFGNAISMIILSRPQMKSSINYLLIGLARCDTMLIIISVSNIIILINVFKKLIY